MLIRNRRIKCGIPRHQLYVSPSAYFRCSLSYKSTDLETRLVYWPMVEASVGIVGACLPLLRPLFVGAASHGFMRSLKNVNIHSLNLNEETLKQLGDDSPGDPGSTTAFTKFGSESTIVPPNAVYSS